MFSGTVPIKVGCLKDHQPLVEECLEEANEKTSIPASQLVPDEVMEYINETKDRLRNCDSDIKDAKRRINSVKTKKPKQAHVEECASSESEKED